MIVEARTSRTGPSVPVWVGLGSIRALAINSVGQAEWWHDFNWGQVDLVGLPLAHLLTVPYITFISGALASIPKVPPGNTNGPRARFFVPR